MNDRRSIRRYNRSFSGFLNGTQFVETFGLPLKDNQVKETRMKNISREFWSSVLLLCTATVVFGQTGSRESWRYYRPGNTGIQGDFNETIWIGPDNDPWIGGYNPVSEEGGIAKFIQGQNRWVNVSNVDYSVIGNANEVGVSRATEMVEDGRGNLWIGTWRGVLRMNLAQGPSSLVKFGPANSTVADGRIVDIAVAPDGVIWTSGEGGLNRYNPQTRAWKSFPTRGGDLIAIQPKATGGYFLWTSPPGYIQANVERFDSTTKQWTSFAPVTGNPSHLVSKTSVDARGNLWMRRWIGDQNEEVLGYFQRNGTWVTPSVPAANGPVSVAALLPFGDKKALMVDGFNQLQQFDGTSWTNMGPVPHSGFIDDLDRDSNGNVWLCGSGTGGAVRRDAVSGVWQRYRVTNTSQFDFFNMDLSVDPKSNNVFATANANSDTGGMVKFDGVRWTGFVNQLGYGLGGDWPFTGSPQSEAVCVRPSNGQVVVNPINAFTHQLGGTGWNAISGGPDQVFGYVEDSLGRLWASGHNGGLGIFQNGGFTEIETGYAGKPVRDTKLPGAVWANLFYEVVRTDGVDRYAKGPYDIPGLDTDGSNFMGLAVQPNGIVWTGAASATGSSLVKIDPSTGVSQVVCKYGVNWPFPGSYVEPVAATPDGRIWMKYGKDYPFDDMGLLWWDGKKVGVYPAPPNGEWRFGGLPHYIINDLEVKIVPGGYELWMTCYSRGIAVLKVRTSS